MIDSHCHLADEAYDQDLEAVVTRAREAGVTSALCILAAGSAREAERATRVSALWPEARFAVGVHPHQANNFAGRLDEAVNLVRQQLNDPRVRAIGEIGLDFHYDFSPPDLQREVFRRQVRLAREMGMPVIIHMREASTETFGILRDEGGGEVQGICHCFTGDAAEARAALDLGFHLSFSGIVTFPRATALRDAAKLVPGDRLLVETDSPYLAPVPHRGKRNEPAWVAHVIDAVAAARGESASAVALSTDRTFAALLRP